MTDTDLNNVRVIAEDSGTGAPFDAQTGDYVSGGDLLALALQSGGGDYIEDGFDVTYDSSATQIDVTGGLLFVRYEGGVTVQGSQTGDYNVPFNAPIAFGLYSTGATNLSVDAGAVNDVWVSIDPTGGDSAFLRYGSSVTTPSAPALKIAEVDTGTGAVTSLNRDPSEAFEDVSVTNPPSSDTDVVRRTELDDHKADSSNPHSVTLEQARAQDNTFVGSVNFPEGGFNVGGGQFALTYWGMVFGSHNQTDRGDTGTSRILEKTSGGTLSINPAGDFFGGVNVGSPLRELGNRVLTENDRGDFQERRQVTTISFANGDYQVSDGEAVLVDASSREGTITLPTPAEGLVCWVKKVDESANPVTIATPGGETIDGDSSHPIPNAYRSRTITSDGTNYFIL